MQANKTTFQQVKTIKKFITKITIDNFLSIQITISIECTNFFFLSIN